MKKIQNPSKCIRNCLNMFMKKREGCLRSKAFKYVQKKLQICSKSLKNHQRYRKLSNMSENVQLCSRKFRNQCKKFKTLKEDQKALKNDSEYAKMMENVAIWPK